MERVGPRREPRVLPLGAVAGLAPRRVDAVEPVPVDDAFRRTEGHAEGLNVHRLRGGRNDVIVWKGLSVGTHRANREPGNVTGGSGALGREAHELAARRLACRKPQLTLGIADSRVPITDDAMRTGDAGELAVADQSDLHRVRWIRGCRV